MSDESTGNHPSVNRPFDRSISVSFAIPTFYPYRLSLSAFWRGEFAVIFLTCG
jgi:hypothetical protein